VLLVALVIGTGTALVGAAPADLNFPRPLDSYPAANGGIVAELRSRVAAEPFNLIATLIFFAAVLHTFLAPQFMRLSHYFERRYHEKLERLRAAGVVHPEQKDVSFVAEALHFFGEIEAIFGIWVVPLVALIAFYKDWSAVTNYLSQGVNFTEPMFVVVIMTMAASRPVLKLAESALAAMARLGLGAPGAWWLSILTFGPVLGSFITEPAAMTISALLLSQRFYALAPRPSFAYATLGLLFVNISVGGTLTHFAAPPVLMVAGQWGWGLAHVLVNFGGKAVLGIVMANAVYFLWFRKHFRELAERQREQAAAAAPDNDRSVPVWITIVHLLFLAWTVANNHYPVMFIGAFLFYVAFTEATEPHQQALQLRPALLVGFFLAGLVIHGGLQGWWIQPVLRNLAAFPLFTGATVLTAFNDNAAITYLATFVPGFSDDLKYAVVAGAVTGGGLTVIANAPNPAGQSILSKHFPNGVSPLALFAGAFVPTVILALCFLLLK